MKNVSIRPTRFGARLCALVVIALVSTSCLYYPSALRDLGGAERQTPWWCESTPELGDLECLLLSGQIDVMVNEAQHFLTVADAMAAGAAEVALDVPGIGTAYTRPGAPDTFNPAYPQLSLYAGDSPGDRLAGVAHLIDSGTAPPEGYPGDRDDWIATPNGWLLPLWVVPGYENHPDVFAAGHPCLADGVTLTSTSDACFVASHTDPLEIMVTNDDGIRGHGIDAIVEALRVTDGVTVSVVAPATNQSGTGESFTPGGTTSSPSTTLSGFPGIAVNGTPADSVLHALTSLKVSPGLVISGINDGQNLGPVVALSGTVGAARTAARNGIQSIAVSQGGLTVQPNFPDGVDLTLDWLEDFRLGLVGKHYMAVPNLNAPSCLPGETIRGIVETFTAVAIGTRSYFAQNCASSSDLINDDIDAFNQGYSSISDVGLYTPRITAGSTNVVVPDADICEVNGNECLLPFPSNALTVPDSSTATGLRVDIATEAMPTNTGGISIDTTHHNRNDGFGPGSAALVLVPGVDPTQSGLPPVTDIGASLLDTSASVVIDANTGQRWPHWSEVDSNATDPNRQGLFVRPAKNYTTGHRIIIGLRNLVDGAGNPIEATDAFVAYRDRLKTNDPDVEARRPAMEALFVDLTIAGVARDELVMAWDFTIISNDSLTGPLFAMADDAFADLGAESPSYTINTVSEDAGGQRRVIEGTYDIPLYLTNDGSTGNGLNTANGDIIPTRNGTWTAPFRCQVPYLDSATPAGPGVVYGHGLLGSGRQATSSGPTALSRNNFVVCGTDLIGMAEEDVPTAVAALQDAGNFFKLAERLMQGHLNEIFLGRLLAHPEGFADDPAFQIDGRVSIDTDRTYFYGISQGGIMGAATTAVSPDIDRAVFGVPGVNYSTLLNRSIDFDLYQQILDPSYPDKLDQAVVLLADQMLWDRGEGNGYISLFAQPLPGMNQKSGLLHPALGDHQVANVAADVMARSMGASVNWPGVAPDRTTDVEPFWGINRITSYPHVGSATIMWDSGSPLSPTTNTSDFTGEDPHSDPRTEPAAVEQLAQFLLTGEVIDVCAGAPCTATPK